MASTTASPPICWRLIVSHTSRECEVFTHSHGAQKEGHSYFIDPYPKSRASIKFKSNQATPGHAATQRLMVPQETGRYRSCYGANVTWFDPPQDTRPGAFRASIYIGK